MKNILRKDDGYYHVNGQRFPKLIGSRAQVFHGTAYKTSGGLTKKDLIKNKSGHVVSAKKHRSAKKHNRLLEYGYSAKKGAFGAVKIEGGRRSRRTRRRRYGGGGHDGVVKNAADYGSAYSGRMTGKLENISDHMVAP